MFQLAWIDFQKFVAGKLRLLEERRAKGNAAALHEISVATDGEVIRKWLWILSIVGGPSCFLVIPFALSMLQPFLWAPLVVILWVLAKVLMVLVFFTFLLAAFFTYKSAS